jgi:hypothetical protein
MKEKKKRVRTPEQRARKNAWQRAKRQDPGYRARENALRRAKRQDPGYRVRENAGNKRAHKIRMQDPGYRARKRAIATRYGASLKGRIRTLRYRSSDKGRNARRNIKRKYAERIRALKFQDAVNNMVLPAGRAI